MNQLSITKRLFKEGISITNIYNNKKFLSCDLPSELKIGYINSAAEKMGSLLTME